MIKLFMLANSQHSSCIRAFVLAWLLPFLFSCTNPLGGSSSSQPNFLSGAVLTDNTSILFGQGTSVGTAWDGTNNYLRLVQIGSPSNNSELDSTWTPQWSNVLAYWKLDENLGTSSAIDSSGNGINGSVNGGVTFGVSGKMGSSAQFDGSTGYIDAGTGFSSSSSMTVSAWINPTVSTLGSSGDYCGIVSLGKSSNVILSFSLVNANNTLRLEVQNTTGSYQSVSGPIIPINQWTFVVGSISGGTLSLWVNGVLYSTASFTGTPEIADTSFHLAVGKDWYTNATQRYFAGSLDDVAVWNTGISSATVTSIYNRQSPKYAGIFQSRIVDGISSSPWSSLSWISTLPFMKGLPDYLNSSLQNETSSNYASLQGDTPAVGDNNLMTGLQLLWHLDDAVGTSGSNSVLDRSGQGNHGTTQGTVTFGVAGKIGTAASFNGGSSISTTNTFTNPNVFTLAAWFNTTSANGGTVIGFNNGGSADRFVYLANSGIVYFGVFPGTIQTINSTLAYNDGNWHHVVATLSSAGMVLYVDGSRVANLASVTSGQNYTAPWMVGAGYGGGGWPNTPNNPKFTGSIDEAAVWSKALNASEVLQLYRRGANRIKYQVRSCSDSACSTNPTWLGPNNTNQTYFSELNNNAVQSDGGDLTSSDAVLAGLPKIGFGNFSSLALPTNRYFQYRAVMESDDTSTNCNYGSGATWCSPELKSVTVSH